jgi:hypothetical protein
MSYYESHEPDAELDPEDARLEAEEAAAWEASAPGVAESGGASGQSSPQKLKRRGLGSWRNRQGPPEEN